MIDISEIREMASQLRAILRDENVALSASGKAFALVVQLVDGESPAELERTIVMVRAQHAVARMRARAEQNGLDRLTSAEIDEEICLARAARRSETRNVN